MNTAADVLAERATWSVDVGHWLTWLRTLPSASVQCCVTSPPYYGLRRYLEKGHKDEALEVGSEKTPTAYVAALVEGFGEVRRVLREDGTLLLNIGDSYASGTKGSGGKANSTLNAKRDANGVVSGKSIVTYDTVRFNLESSRLKPKDLIGVPWMLAFALREAGWWLRSEMIWHKLAPMPESVRDRPTKAHEQVFLLAKESSYFWDAEAVRTPLAVPLHAPGNQKWADEDRNDGDRLATPRGSESGANLRTVLSLLSLSPESCKDAHFAVMPSALASICIRAATSAHGCCPRCGAPWRRHTTRTRKPTRPGDGSKVPDYYKGLNEANPQITHGTGSHSTAKMFPNSMSLSVGNRDPQRHCTEVETLGWLPSCQCPASDPVGCLVLDPFAGAGTTGLVSRGLGRRFIGVELNDKYALIARRRIGGANPLFDFA